MMVDDYLTTRGLMGMIPAVRLVQRSKPSLQLQHTKSTAKSRKQRLFQAQTAQPCKAVKDSHPKWVVGQLGHVATKTP